MLGRSTNILCNFLRHGNVKEIISANIFYKLWYVQEKYSAADFVDKKIIDIELAKPPPVESSPYKLVEEVKDLKELAATLKGVNEFAVSLG